MVEDRFRKILYDFSNEETDARTEISERAHREHTPPAQADELRHAGRGEASEVAVWITRLTRLSEGAVASDTPAGRSAR